MFLLAEPTRVRQERVQRRGWWVNYSEIKYCDSANSTSVRTTFFVSSCKRHYPFCFNEVARKFSASKPFTKDIEDTIIKSIEPFYVDGLSTLGDESMEPENQRGLVNFLEHVKRPIRRSRSGSTPVSHMRSLPAQSPCMSPIRGLHAARSRTASSRPGPQGHLASSPQLLGPAPPRYTEDACGQCAHDLAQ
jgi:hypothetical protein